MSPFYSRLNVPGFGADTTAETVGLTVVGAVSALTLAHAAGKGAQSLIARRAAEARPGVDASGQPAPPSAPPPRKWAANEPEQGAPPKSHRDPFVSEHEQGTADEDQD